MNDNSGEPSGFVVIAFFVWIIVQPITYVMAAFRWFGTPYGTFWLDFKELVWALCPVANIAYVWDMWVGAFLFILAFAHRVISN